MKLERILVPTDFSEAADKAFEQAVALAKGGGVQIRVLHRLASPLPILPAAPYPGLGNFEELGTMVEQYMTEAKRGAEESLEKLVASAPADVEIETALEERLDTVAAIEKAVSEWSPDLLAMGTHGRSGFNKLLLGSIATKVLHQTDTNALLVRADSQIFGGSKSPLILVPVDFSDDSLRALGFARLLAGRFEGRLHLMHVVELEHTPLEPGGLTSRFEKEPALRGKYEEALRDMLAGSEGDVTVAEGSVAGEILWWREKLGADLIVLGSRGLKGLKRVLVGSVAEQVTRFSEVPVTIVK